MRDVERVGGDRRVVLRYARRALVATVLVAPVAAGVVARSAGPAVAAVSNVVFNTDVTVAGREETVWVTATSAGTVSVSIDFNRNDTFEASEQVVTNQPVVAGVNRVVYTAPTGSAFVPGTGARARISSAPDGGFIDVLRELFDAEGTALAQCPAGLVPIPVSIIQNPSFESRTGNFSNVGSANTINFATGWFDRHPTGGQYLYFDPPTFDSGPAATTMPVRAGADGQAFLGGHSAGVNRGEGATNTLLVPLNPDSTYVGFFSMAAGGFTRTGNGYMQFFGVSNRDVGHLPGTGVVPPTAANTELLYTTPAVNYAGNGVRPIWDLNTFAFNPSQAWPFLRVEVRNVNPALDSSATTQVWMNFDDFHMFECTPRLLQITKTSNATVDTRPGDTIEYTITATNVGAADFTAAAPAVVLDDLEGVLDDATYNNDATADVGSPPTFASSRLTWAGPLVSGASVTITYSVTVAGGGDGVVRNVAFQSRCVPGPATCPPPPTPEPCVQNVDPATGLPCDDVVIELPRLSIVKSASRTELPAAGEEVTFTVTVANIGPGSYTATAPAAMTDDLSDVIDDTTEPDPISATLGSAGFQSGELSWSGALVSGQSAVITYTVTYTGAGNQRLANLACVPAGEAVAPQLACVQVTIPGSGLVQTKVVNPPTGTSIDVGDTVTYTLAFTNTGNSTANVDTTDSLEAVLDDATLTAGPTADPGLTATLTGDVMEVSGTVPVNQTSIVTYTVTVDAFADQNDHVLRNALACQPGEPQPCTPQSTEHRVRHLSLSKASNAAPEVNIGDVITYTLTISNDGAGDYAPADPGSIDDELTEVLDDAVYNNDATATAGTTAYAAPILSWSGALTAGETSIVTYTVTVTSAGDHRLQNTAQVIGCIDDPACSPPPVTTPLPHVVPAKTSNPSSGTSQQAGDVITYTLTFTNDGQATGVVDATDELSDILDDADITAEPVSSQPAITAIRTTGLIRITGELEPDVTVTVTYQVTIRPDGERGNNIARNVLTPDVPPVVCAADDCTPVPPPRTEHPLGLLDVWKTVDPPSGSTVQPGATVTFTLHFASTGVGNARVSHDDVLSDVVDDATISAGPSASSSALTISPLTADRFTITGTLTPGQEVTVSYSVTVSPDGQRGNDRVGNFLVDSGVQPADTCVPTESPSQNCSLNHVANLTVVKTSDQPAGTRLQPDSEVTYALTFTNVSANPAAAPQTVDYTDHLADLLDDATITGEPKASDPAIGAGRSGATIRITGQLTAGQIVTVTYVVRIKPYEQQGDHALRNIVSTTGETPICAPGLCTDHLAIDQAAPPQSPPTTPQSPPTTTPAVPDLLPGTGGDLRQTLQLAIVIVIAGACLVRLSRGRNHTRGKRTHP